MRIWVVNPYDDIPREGQRQRYWTLCDVLVERGHKVTWWSSDWSHRRKARREYLDHSFAPQYGFELQLIQTPVYKENVGLSRLRNHRYFAQELERAGNLRLDEGAPDLVIVSWPPMGAAPVALRWRQRCGCRVVLDVMDAWPNNFLMLAPRNRICQAMARLVLTPWFRRTRILCREVDAVSAQSNAFAQWAQQNGSSSVVHVCYLGAFQGKINLGSVIQRSDAGEGDCIANRHCLRLLYLGAMGRVYDLETLIEAVFLLRKQGVSVLLELAGEGEKLPALKEQVKRLSLGGAVKFHGYVQGGALEALLQRCDLGVIPMLPESMVAVPYKAGEYLSAGLPVISSLPGELDHWLSEYQCGARYESGNAESLARVIGEYVGDCRRLAAEKVQAISLFRSNFDRSATYQAWAKWLENVCA